MARQVEGEPYFRMSVDEASELHDNEEKATVFTFTETERIYGRCP